MFERDAREEHMSRLENHSRCSNLIVVGVAFVYCRKHSTMVMKVNEKERL